MFAPKPCLPVSVPSHKRKRLNQPQAPNEDDKDSNDTTTNISKDITDSADDEPIDDDDDVDESNMDAATYLYHVREEARQLPNIWTANVKNERVAIRTATATTTTTTTTTTQTLSSSSKSNERSSKTNQKTKLKKSNKAIFGSMSSLQYLTSHNTKIYSPPTINHIPKMTKEWVDEILLQFSNLRFYLDQYNTYNYTTHTQQQRQSQRQPVPPMKDYLSWCTFCLGCSHTVLHDDNHGSEGNNDKHDDKNNATTIQQPKLLWENNLPPYGNEPTSTLLLQMDQVMVRRVLHHLSTYINIDVEINETTSSTNLRQQQQQQQQQQCFMWIYALLARLEKPIHRDDAVTLYTLLKRLTLLRSQIQFGSTLEPTQHTLSSLRDNNEDVTQSRNDLINSLNDNNDRSNSKMVDITDGEITSDGIKEVNDDRNYLATLNVLIAIIGIYFEQGGGYSNVMECK